MIRRFFTSLLQEMLEVFPVVAVIGARQVGKSTLVTLPEIGAGRSYLNLDDITLRPTAQEDPKALLDSGKPLTIDEVHLAPVLLREIKRLTDKDRVPCKFLLTGSADLDHCAELSSVLAGRVGILPLPPITHSEEHESMGWRTWLESRSVSELDEAFEGRSYPAFEWSRILSGGFPLSLLAPTARKRSLWIESFRTTYLERDLRRISDISNLADFARLMQLSSHLTGSILNQASLARDAGMSPGRASCLKPSS